MFTLLKIGHHRTIDSVSHFCKSFLKPNKLIPQSFSSFYNADACSFIILSLSFMKTIFSSASGSEDSVVGSFSLKHVLIVFSLLKVVKNSIRKGYKFTITVIPIVHDIHIQICNTPQFPTLVWFWYFWFGQSVWFCLSPNIVIWSTRSGS